MNIQLLNGHFSSLEAIDLLAQFVQVKVRFHENKIEKSQNEEDIKMREKRIKQLQQDFFEAKQQLLKQPTTGLNAEIKIN
ncbi:hypothetical protein FHS57_001456 [Runella defluvii]|uniref:Uncharacterized protein n=1 Tax=Runella defluvii TaxID=370973 RepID=A0A7W5ZKF8_9BACT|nr:hypothetical protein [Runella defluvii]MBB3837462.1 hypothetical protein [Runella defluvii]